MGVRVKVGFKDSVGVQIGQNFPEGTFGVHVASGALGTHGRRRATPLATNCWPKAPKGGGGGGAGVVGVLGPAESPPPWSTLHIPPMELMGMDSVKCVTKNGKWGQWLKGLNLSAIESLEQVQVLANTGKTLPPSNLRTPFGARHQSTALYRWGVFHPKKLKQRLTVEELGVPILHPIFLQGR